MYEIPTSLNFHLPIYMTNAIQSYGMTVLSSFPFHILAHTEGPVCT